MRGLFRNCALGVALSAALVGGLGCSPGNVRRSSDPALSVQASEAQTPAQPESAVEPTSPAPTIARVRVKPTAKVSEGFLTASASTNLMDGAFMSWQVGTGAGDNWRVRRAGKATVVRGRISFRTDVRARADSKLYLFLTFTTYGQSPVVKARYGETGQNLRGDHLQMHGDYRTLEYWVTVAR